MLDQDFYEQVDTALSKIEYCSQKCVYYVICPVCDRTGSDIARCALRMLPDDKRRRFVNLYLRGREGFKAEAIENLFNYGMKLNLHGNSASADDIRKYVEMLVRVDKTFRTDHRVKEIPLIEQEALPEVIDVTVTKAAEKPHPDQKVVNKVKKDMDDNPDSLWNSPKIDAIIEGADIPESDDAFSKELEKLKEIEENE